MVSSPPKYIIYKGTYLLLLPSLAIHWGAEQQFNLRKVSGLKSLQKFWVWNFILLDGDFGCSKFPLWLAAFAPLNSMLIEEKAWNAYPKCKTGWSLSWPFNVGTRFSSTIFSLPENVVFLTQEVVAHDTSQGFSAVGLVSSITIHNMWQLLWHILYQNGNSTLGNGTYCNSV
jgi:hypothetical protein